MTVRSAISTPRQLPRKREHADNCLGLSLAGAVTAQSLNHDINSNWFELAKTIQTKENESGSRLVNLVRIDAIRTEIRNLVEVIGHGADIEPIDLMRDEVGSYSQHKAIQEARTWPDAAGAQLETGLIMLDHTMLPTNASPVEGKK